MENSTDNKKVHVPSLEEAAQPTVPVSAEKMPDISETPEVPEISDVPDVPEVLEVPDTFDVPEVQNFTSDNSEPLADPTTISELADPELLLDATTIRQSAVSAPTDLSEAQPQLSKLHNISIEAEAQRQRTKSHKRLVVAFVLLMVLLGVAGAFVAYGAELWGGKTIPSVRNEKADKAKRTLSDLGFSVIEKTKKSDSGIGLVVEQEPPAGERHEKGTEVTIWIGEARVMPEVVGNKVEDARQVLQEAGATAIKVKSKPAKEEAGTVLDSDPKAGEPFTSDKEIVLVVAEARTLPDLVGKTEQEAKKALDALGIEFSTKYIKSDKDGRTVVKSDPAAGSKLASDTKVTLSISDPYPTGVKQFAEYFRHRPADVAEFLRKQGFAYQGGYVDGRGDAQVLYSNGAAKVRFCSDPFDHNFNSNGSGKKPKGGSGKATNKGAQGDAVANGATFRGVRYEYAAGEIPGSAHSLDATAIEEVMAECGLSNASEECTEDTIVVPAKLKDMPKKDGRLFSCVSGTEGEYTWTILIAQVKKGSDNVRVVVTYALTSLYDEYDRSGNGGRICDFVAYVDMYA